ncbi:hypothetical protein ABZ366_33140, partial [Streptomyces sp. NPDC005904]
MRRVSRVATTALAMLALAAASPGAARALPSADARPPASPTPPGSDDNLPRGGRVVGEGTGRQ